MSWSAFVHERVAVHERRRVRAGMMSRLETYDSLLEHYNMSEDWEGGKFAGIDLAWNHDPCHSDCICRLLMDGYLAELLLCKGHNAP